MPSRGDSLALLERQAAGEVARLPRWLGCVLASWQSVLQTPAPAGWAGAGCRMAPSSTPCHLPGCSPERCSPMHSAASLNRGGHCSRRLTFTWSRSRSLQHASCPKMPDHTKPTHASGRLLEPAVAVQVSHVRCGNHRPGGTRPAFQLNHSKGCQRCTTGAGQHVHKSRSLECCARRAGQRAAARCSARLAAASWRGAPRSLSALTGLQVARVSFQERPVPSLPSRQPLSSLEPPPAEPPPQWSRCLTRCWA